MNTLRTALRERMNISNDKVTLMYQEYADLTHDGMGKDVAFNKVFGWVMFSYKNDGELSQYYNGKEK